MKRVNLPALLFRAHSNDVDPLEPSTKSGGYRWDDFRPESTRRFHVLYTGDSIEGCFIERLQPFSGGDDDARAILANIVEDDLDPAALLPKNVVPVSVLRGLAASALEVADPTQSVVDPFDVPTLGSLHSLAERLNIAGVPSQLKAGDLLGVEYAIPQRISTVIFELFNDACGIVSRSALDNPRTERPHTNFNLYRDLPENGGTTRAEVRRSHTSLALSKYSGELQAALTHLNATPAFPLSSPELMYR
jgi:hypothetical protein